MIHRLLLALLTLIALSTNAQNFIRGVIQDKETKAPLPFVTIEIISKGVGTNTNTEGQFQLFVLDTNKNDTLRFSFIGYITRRLPIAQLLSKDNPVLLEAKTYSLGEVTVKAKKLIPDDVIRNVIKNKERNYSYSPFKLDAYYREIRNVNDKYDHLIEIALSTYGKSVEKYHEKVELLNSRKIDHVPFTHEENLLNSTLRLDYIANGEGFIKLSDFKKNKYTFEDIRLEDNKTIYVISSGIFPDRKYTYYIREDDFAIIRLEMEDWYAERGKLYIGPIDRTHQFRLRHFKVVNSYRQYENNYYPDYLSVRWDYDKYNSVTKTVYENSSWLREFRVNQIFTTNYAQPDLSRLMSKFGSKIDDQMTEYDPAFWKNYNLVPLTTKMISDLESSGALEDQFIKNGTQAKKRKKFKCDKGTGVENVICLIKNYHDLYKIPGAQLSVSVNGNLVLSEAFGYADMENKIHVTTKTPFHIASVSKTLTAVCAMKLMEDGLLDPDVPIQKYVPSFPEKKWPITSRQLLNNTSGIRHYLDNEDFYRSTQYHSMTEAIGIFKDDSLLFQPGKGFRYSSFGFNLLGAVIEGASKKNYLDYLQTTILTSLMMNSTYGERNNSATRPDESKSYVIKDNQKIVGPPENLSYKWSSGGLTSTAEDLVKFGSGLLQGKILKKETVAKLLSSQLIFDTNGYSLGWFVDTDGDGKIMIHHSGTTPGYSSHLLIYPDKGIVIAYLANTGMDTFFDKDFADEIIKTIEKK